MEAFIVDFKNDEKGVEGVGGCIIAKNITNLREKHPSSFVLDAFTCGGLGLEYIAGEEGSKHREFLEIFLGMAYFANLKIKDHPFKNLAGEKTMKAFMVNYRSDGKGVGGCEIAKKESQLRDKYPNALILETFAYGAPGLEYIAGEEKSDHRALLKMFLGMAYFANSETTGPDCFLTSWHREQGLV